MTSYGWNERRRPNQVHCLQPFWSWDGNDRLFVHLWAYVGKRAERYLFSVFLPKEERQWEHPVCPHMGHELVFMPRLCLAHLLRMSTMLLQHPLPNLPQAHGYSRLLTAWQTMTGEKTVVGGCTQGSGERDMSACTRPRDVTAGLFYYVKVIRYVLPHLILIPTLSESDFCYPICQDNNINNYN